MKERRGEGRKGEGRKSVCGWKSAKVDEMSERALLTAGC